MTKTFIGFNKKTTAALVKGFESPMKKGKLFFRLLAVLMDQATQLTFRLNGARGGHSRWAKFSLLTLHPSWFRGGTRIVNMTKWNKRRGTDGNKKRRYSSGSKMLRASGGFRNSFRTIGIAKDRLTYGIRSLKMRNLGKEIMSDPDREVLFVTAGDRKAWGALFANFYAKGLKF